METEDNRRVIEFVGVRNKGISKIAEAYFQYLLDNEGITDFRAASSGTDVRKLHDSVVGKKPFPEDYSRFVLKQAAIYGDESARDLERRLIKGNNGFVAGNNGLEKSEMLRFDSGNIQNYVRLKSLIYGERESHSRDSILREAGVSVDPSAIYVPNQTKQDGRIVLALGIEPEQLKFLEDLNRGEPIIVNTLAGYVNGNYGGGLRTERSGEYLQYGQPSGKFYDMFFDGVKPYCDRLINIVKTPGFLDSSNGKSEAALTTD